MLAAETKKKYTADDYLLLEEGAPFQLINYDLVMSPSPLFIHQIISARLTQALLNFLDSTNSNAVVANAPTDVRFDDGNILQPDILYISEGRIAEIIKDRVEGAPDMIIEILSPSNAYYDLRTKKDIYEKYGVKEYIIVDPIQQTTELYALKNGLYYLHQKAPKNELLHSLVLPGFSFDLSRVFV